MSTVPLLLMAGAFAGGDLQVNVREMEAVLHRATTPARRSEVERRLAGDVHEVPRFFELDAFELRRGEGSVVLLEWHERCEGGDQPYAPSHCGRVLRMAVHGANLDAGSITLPVRKDGIAFAALVPDGGGPLHSCFGAPDAGYMRVERSGDGQLTITVDARMVMRNLRRPDVPCPVTHVIGTTVLESTP